MERVAVESEALRSVGYDRRSRVLEIEFTSGTVYRYLGVPEPTYAALMQADSLGGYFSEHIRDAGFMLDRIGEAESGNAGLSHEAADHDVPADSTASAPDMH